MYDYVFFAFTLTLIAGLATGIGGAIALVSKKENKFFLSVCLSFAAGVMIYISFVEIFFKAYESLEYAGEDLGYPILTVSFFAGIALMSIISKLIPHGKNPSEFLENDKRSLKRTGLTTATAIAVHNFPEGLITFVAALYDPAMGIAVAAAIIIHNIPEGIAVASPIYHATGSKIKAFLVSLGAGITEPIGALIAWLLLRNFVQEINEIVLGVIFAIVGGIMVYVAFSQLLPAARKYGQHKTVITWLFLGMAVMAAGLVLLELVM